MAHAWDKMESMRPMLATKGSHVPTGPEWLHEVKWDGMRVLADIRDGHLTLTSRAGNDVTASYPELAPLADLYDDMLAAIDGAKKQILFETYIWKGDEIGWKFKTALAAAAEQVAAACHALAGRPASAA